MSFQPRTPRLAFSIVLIVAAGPWAAPARGDLPFEGEPINYLTARVDDPVARLQAKMEEGEAALKYDRKRGYLDSVLEELGVPVASQVLVFSKTSFQHNRISPRTPRALYFNDDVYVGYVRGGDVLEVVSIDPKQGATFYLMEQERADRPSFQRQTHECLQCHASPKTRDVPGLLVRSIYPDGSGLPVYNAGTFVTDHTSPLKERWGGWYVTGNHGRQTHMGNVFVTDRDHPEQLDTARGANVLDLSDRFNTSRYLSGQSDIVALMTLEHQTQAHNLITLAGFQTRLALHYEAGINKALDRPAGSLSPTSERRFKHPAEELLRYLLFVGETPLTDPIAGTSGFTEQFAARGPRDPKGRSLRDFDLRTRMFKYPCSYLIYSESFDAMPEPVKGYVLHRLFEVLTGRDTSPDFQHLTADDRRAILEILRATKPGLPAEWSGAQASSTVQGPATP